MEAVSHFYDVALGTGSKKFFEKIHSKAPHLRLRNVAAYRDYLQRHGPKVEDVVERAKNSAEASQCRLQGNEFYRRKMYSFALEKYSESVCLAPEGSTDLAMGYANCSAVLLSGTEYEHTLLAIAKAKKHNYPDQLMPKLLKREAECKQKIATGQSGCRPNKISPFKLNVPTNPKIPFLADGITMKTLPGYGRSMVAEREFKAGDIILDEEFVTSTINSAKNYLACQFCTFTIDGCPVPCPRCASVVYCTEECRKADMEGIHRFECGITGKLDHITIGASRIGVRMFLHGLNLFNDDVDKMMDFCKAHARSGSNPLLLDYTKRDPLEEFKVFHQTVVPEINLKTDRTRIQAALYYLILIDHPPVGSLIRSDAQKDFMLHCIHDYIRTALFLASYLVNMENYRLNTVAAICNNACIPNTFAVASGRRLMFIVLRRIQPGEQILTCYSIMHVEDDAGHDNPYPRKLSTPFKCICPVCKPSATRVANVNRPPPIPREHIDGLCHSLFGEEYDPEAQLVSMRQMMERYGHLHPDYPMFDQYIRKYRALLMMVYLHYIHNAYRVHSTAEVAKLENTVG